jgi:UDP-N-acetylmuramoyl-tripeptide--D-alanyl-D-alanine ligase
LPALSFARIAEMTGGELLAGGEVVSTSVVIDSREAKPGSVFFAIRGDRLDGHDFLAEALECAAGAVVSRMPDNPGGAAIVRVDDTLLALQDLARAVRRERSFVLVAITGSAGKTTTKEIIAEIASRELATWKSVGNFNNHIGFPLCLANTPDGTDVVVSEMGMSAKGEIEFLARMSRPDIGVYTNVQPVHLEFFDSIDGIAAAKRELLENLADGGSVVINADDARVVALARGFPGRVVTYGIDHDADYRASGVRSRGLFGTDFDIVAEGATRVLDFTLPGRHNLENALAAIAAARLAGVSWSGIESGLSGIRPAAHRGVVVDWKGATLYDDTYNSNPHALDRALQLLAEAECVGRRIAIVGDMLELGPGEEQFHRDAGRTIPGRAQLLVAVGPRSLAIVEGAKEAGMAADRIAHFADAAEAVEHVQAIVRPGDIVLFKASRGIGLDRIVAALEEDA